MAREQRWLPDTHPGVEFIVRYYDSGRAPRCIRAVVDGVEQDDPQGLWETAMAENRLKNEALELLTETAPFEMKAALTDEDGDPKGMAADGEEVVMIAGQWFDRSGLVVTGQVKPLFALKAKHAPQWRFGGLDGRLEVFVPFLPSLALETIGAALMDRFGDKVRLVEQ